MLKITTKKEIGELMNTVGTLVKKNGGTMTKNTIEVSSVKIKYEIYGQDIYIEILDKPWIFSEETVEKKIKEFFT